MPWTVVIPVRAPGKTRLGRGPEFARAIALDTIAAAVAAADVVVVTADGSVAREAQRLGASVVREEAPAGIDAAIAAGFPGVGTDRAVLLGDLPALRPEDLAAALADASAHPRAYVADADGTGTTLVTASAGVSFLHRFGTASAAAHRAAGLIELPIAADSPLRRDVDLEEHVTALGASLGPRTRAALAR